MAEEVDKKSSNIFKFVVEYFAKNSTSDIFCRYEGVLKQAFEKKSFGEEFSSLMEVYRNSSPEAVIKIKLDNDISKLSSKDEYANQIIKYAGEIKNYAQEILANFDKLEDKHNFLINRITNSAKSIYLVPDPNTSITFDYLVLTDKLESIHSCFLQLKNALPLTKSKSNTGLLFYSFL